MNFSQRSRLTSATVEKISRTIRTSQLHNSYHGWGWSRRNTALLVTSKGDLGTEHTRSSYVVLARSIRAHSLRNACMLCSQGRFCRALPSESSFAKYRTLNPYLCLHGAITNGRAAQLCVQQRDVQEFQFDKESTRRTNVSARISTDVNVGPGPFQVGSGLLFLEHLTNR